MRVSLVGRVWTALVAIIALILVVLSVLAVLQHDAVFSQLIRQRLAVTVEGTARPIRSIVELGLPIAMVRNKLDLLELARDTDPAIENVVLFNPSGIVVEATAPSYPDQVPEEVLWAQSESGAGRWSLETDTELISGASILSDTGAIVGGIFAVYPTHELQERGRAVARQITIWAAGLLVLFSASAYVIVRWRLRPVVRFLRGLEAALASIAGTLPPARRRAWDGPVDRTKLGLLGSVLGRFEEGLDAASRKFEVAEAKLAALSPELTGPPTLDGPRESVPIGIPETALTRTFARRLMPIVAGLTLGSALVLGYVAYLSISASFSPEIAKRTQLIGTDASVNIRRAVEAGVPIESLVGGSEYFSDLLADFPEISYFGIITDKPLLEVGSKLSGTRGIRASFPVVVDGEEIGEIQTETNPDYIAKQFRDVVFDLGVVVLVTMLFAFELIIVMMTLSVSGPLDRLHFLVNIQTEGDFSKRLMASGRNVIERLGTALSDRAERLSGLLAVAAKQGGEHGLAIVEVLGPGFRVLGRPPAILRFCSLSDVRLPLFLFAIADELPLSFFSLYARAADNPLTWLSEGFVIGLPLAAYLATALLCAPLVRPAGKRFGYRNVFVAAAIVTVFAKLGLFFVHTIVEIILLHGLNGIGFAFAALVCQDYVLDMLPKAARSRSMGLFRATLFGGVFAGTALGGVLADRLGQRPVFIVCAMLALVAAVLIWRLLPVSRQRAGAQDDEGEAEKLSFNVLTPMRDARFAAIALGVVIPQAIIDHVFVSYLLPLQMDGLGASVSDIARVMMCFFLMLILAGSLQDKLPERYRRPTSTLVVSSVLGGSLLIAAALLPSTWMILIATSGAGLALGMAGGPQMVLIMESIEGPLAHLGSSAVLGAVRVLERGGAIAGLLFIGAIADGVGYSGAAGVIGLIALTGVVGFVILRAASARAINSGRKV
jgi:MFS family permease